MPEDRCETDLERLLFPGANPFPERGRPWPDWARVRRELRRPGVTLSLLWQEYRTDHAQDGYQSSRFCDLLYRPALITETCLRL